MLVREVPDKEPADEAWLWEAREIVNARTKLFIAAASLPCHAPSPVDTTKRECEREKDTCLK